MFRSVTEVRGSRFNSTDSCDFLDEYERLLDERIRLEESRQPSKTFAPSQLRCKRISWFRLRGVEPEVSPIANRGLQFTATIGTAIHEAIQSNLKSYLGDDWIDVEDYLKSKSLSFEYNCTTSGYETQVEIKNPPVKFAPDGIIRYKGKLMLLEIKSSEYTSFEKLSAPKPQHINQIMTYGTLLDLDSAFVLYVDRQYGNYKCFEVTITDEDRTSVLEMFNEVMRCVDANIAPPKLPSGDAWCSPARCRYYNKCKEW